MWFSFLLVALFPCSTCVGSGDVDVEDTVLCLLNTSRICPPKVTNSTAAATTTSPGSRRHSIFSLGLDACLGFNFHSGGAFPANPNVKPPASSCHSAGIVEVNSSTLKVEPLNKNNGGVHIPPFFFP